MEVGMEATKVRIIITMATIIIVDMGVGSRVEREVAAGIDTRFGKDNGVLGRVWAM